MIAWCCALPRADRISKGLIVISDGWLVILVDYLVISGRFQFSLFAIYYLSYYLRYQLLSQLLSLLLTLRVNKRDNN